MSKFTADFETVTWLDDETYVWAWATCEIGKEENLVINNSMESFIEYAKSLKNPTFYFHNLKFDGEFLIYWALKNGLKHVQKKEEIENNTFTTLISDMGQFYNIVFYFEKGNKEYKKVTFIDSLKIIPFSVDDTAKYFNLPISKLKLDYNTPREKGHILTDHEREYIKNDVLIMAKALKVIFDEGLTKQTRASNALADFKKIIGNSKFRHYFPELKKELDEELRKSYKGGFTYLNPIYTGKTIKDVNVIDVNSLYPYVMYCKRLPIGEPIYFEGQYKEDKVYDLYIQTFSCSFEIKKDKIPTIQLKNRGGIFRENEYLLSSEEKIVSMTLTSVDLKLFLEQYETKNLKYEKGWKFRSIDTIFKKYIDKWMTRKIEAGKEGNAGQKQLAKLMLNSLYGKLATSLETKSKIPYLGDDEIVHYTLSEKQEKPGVYLPAGSFITAYGREKTIRTSQAIQDYSIKKYGKSKYIYSDTDSIHTNLDIEEIKQFCEIDDLKLGFWAHEAHANKGKFIRQKTYIEEIENKIKITCAGLPPRCYDKVTWNNFKIGFSCTGKLTFKHLKGGLKLVETEFSIKEPVFKKQI